MYCMDVALAAAKSSQPSAVAAAAAAAAVATASSEATATEKRESVLAQALRVDQVVRSNAHTLLASEFGKGATAGVGSILVSYPVGKLVTRQQLEGHAARQAFSHMRAEGAFTLYKGSQPLLAQRGIQIGFMYSIYGAVHARLSSWNCSRPDYQLRFAAGWLAGLVDACVLTPFERTQTIMQQREAQVGRRLGGTRAAVCYLLESGGPRELYRGINTSIIRNSGCNAAYFTLLPLARDVFHSVRARAEAQRWWAVAPLLQSRLVEDFLCGVGLGLGMSVFVFPLSTAMKYQQSQTSGVYTSTIQAIRELTAGRSVRGIYRGLPLYMVRSTIAWGTTNTIYGCITQRAEERGMNCAQ